jgi:hypothetical protein
MASGRSSPSISCNTRELKDFAKVLRNEVPEVAKRLRKRLRAAGMLVRDDAAKRANVIMPGNPPKVKVSISGLRSVSVTAARNVTNAAGEQSPLPALNEYAPGSWKHPVYGNPAVTVSQKATPFLYPALEARGDDAVEMIAIALDETVEAIAYGHDDA